MHIVNDIQIADFHKLTSQTKVIDRDTAQLYLVLRGQSHYSNDINLQCINRRVTGIGMLLRTSNLNFIVFFEIAR